MKNLVKNKFHRSWTLTSLLFTIFLIISGQSCLAQDDLNEIEPIEYNFDTNKFNKVFPFDEIFYIKFINIPPGAQRVDMSFIEYHAKKVKPDPNKGKTVTVDDMRNSSITYETSGLKLPSVSTTNSGNILVPFVLKPNQKYVVELAAYKKEDLTGAEKAALTLVVKNDKEVRNIISKIAIKVQDVNDVMVNYDSFSLTQAEFNAVANRVVKKVDEDYRVRPIDPVTQLRQLADFATSLNNLRQELENIPQNGIIPDNDNRDKIIESISSYKDMLKATDWGNIALNDLLLTAKKDAIFNQLLEKGKLPDQAKNEKDAVEGLFKEAIKNRDAWLNSIADATIADNTYKIVTLNATYRADFVKNAKLYITLDLGAAYVGNIDRILSYSGVNIYLRPVNKNIPLSNYNTWGDWFAVRTSFLVGITMNSIEKPNVRKGLIGNSALVLGAGIRPVPFAKINAGCFVYYKYSNNPLITQDSYHTAISPFISLSIDLDAKSLFGGIGEAIFK